MRLGGSWGFYFGFFFGYRYRRGYGYFSGLEGVIMGLVGLAGCCGFLGSYDFRALCVV